MRLVTFFSASGHTVTRIEEKKKSTPKKGVVSRYLRLTPVRNLIGYLLLCMIGDTAIHFSGGLRVSLKCVRKGEKKEKGRVDIFTVIHLAPLLPVV